MPLRYEFEIVTKWLRKLYDLELGQISFWMKYLSITNNTETKNNKEEKMLGLIINNKLRFKTHLKDLYKRAFQNYLHSIMFNKLLKRFWKKMIFNALIKSQFSYCPLAWMFCSRLTNNMSNKMHERALRLYETITSVILRLCFGKLMI